MFVLGNISHLKNLSPTNTCMVRCRHTNYLNLVLILSLCKQESTGWGWVAPASKIWTWLPETIVLTDCAGFFFLHIMMQFMIDIHSIIISTSHLHFLNHLVSLFVCFPLTTHTATISILSVSLNLNLLCLPSFWHLLSSLFNYHTNSISVNELIMYGRVINRRGPCQELHIINLTILYVFTITLLMA